MIETDAATEIDRQPRPRRRRWRPTPLLHASAGIHLASLIGTLVSPPTWRLAVGAMLVNHMALAGAGMWPRSTLLGPNLKRLPAAEGAVALTFDDGPDSRVTPRVLDLLAEAGAKATFFCIGRRAQQHPEVVSEISARGHLLGNHSFRHPNRFALLGPGGLAREIDSTQTVLTRLGGCRPAHFRAPAGLRSPWLEPLLARRGLHLVSWTRRGFDTVDSNPRRVSQRLVGSLKSGDILVLHDGSLLHHGPRAGIIEALKRVLDALANSSLKSVTLPVPEDAT